MPHHIKSASLPIVISHQVISIIWTLGWLKFIFSKQNIQGHENEGIDPQLKKHQIVKQIILLFSESSAEDMYTDARV